MDALAGKLVGTDALAASLPFNTLKPSEYEPGVLNGPEAGPSVSPRDPIVGASTVSERNGSDKVGSGGAIIGVNKTISSLDRVRVDSSKQALTTNQGVPVADNQHSLKAGLRGPTLLEDFILREKIFTEEQADAFTFDVLDATKIIPEELVPLLPVGRLVLNRNPDNFFAETEQVAFCAAHVVPNLCRPLRNTGIFSVRPIPRV
jgi:hypothetical protein